VGLYVLVAAYNEAESIGPCIDAIAATGIARQQVHVFDGAWTTRDGSHPFDGADGPSTDDTLRAAIDAGAQVHDCDGLWPSQEVKRTAMFHQAGARRGDQLLVIDADERLQGRLRPLPLQRPALLAKRDIGENDLPGIRGEFPCGDWGSPAQLRLFQWSRRLVCVEPGWYETKPGHRIVAYARQRPALPLLKGLWFDHEPAARPPARIAAKRAYYEVEHALRFDGQGRVA
jgi:hypothetical protein